MCFRECISVMARPLSGFPAEDSLNSILMSLELAWSGIELLN